MKFFATGAKGTEGVLADELREIGIDRLRRTRGGVSFAARWEEAWRVCLESRIALRVLFTLAEAPCRSERDLYQLCRGLEWERYVSPETTLSVSAVGSAPGLDNTMFVAQRTKDAIVDLLRERAGARPSVDREDPDISVFVRLDRGRVSVSLDLAGQSLHRRGFRTEAGPAPLKETLAAALLRLAGWDRKRPLVDPMCGSGTIPIEADLWARGVAPGLGRERFGFERWANFDPGMQKRLTRLRERLRAEISSTGPRVCGSDSDPDAIRRARAAAERAGAHVEFQVRGLSELEGTEPPALVIVNPPYGERLALDAGAHRELEATFGRLSPGHRVALLQGPRSGFRPPRDALRFPIMNGALECSLEVWDIA